MMYWLGLVLFAYLLVAAFILGSVILGRHNVVAHGEYSLTEMIAITIFCSLFWPLAMYCGKLRVRFKWRHNGNSNDTK